MKIKELEGTKRQKTQTRAIIFRVTEPTWETLSKMAEENGTTVSAVIRWLLDKGVKSMKKDVKADCACMGKASNAEVGIVHGKSSCYSNGAENNVIREICSTP